MVFNVIVLILLWRKLVKRLADKLLIAIFSCMLLEVVHFYSGLHELDLLTLFTFPVEDSLVFFFGPATYLYVKSLYLSPQGLLWRDRWHFLPLVLYIGLISGPITMSILQDDYLFPYLQYIVQNEYLFLTHMIYLLVYTLLSLRLLRRYQVTIREYFSDLAEVNFQWISYFFYGILLVIAVDLSTSAYEITVGVLSWDTGYLTVFAMIGLVGYLGYHGVSQSRILLPEFLAAQTLEQEMARPQVQRKVKGKPASAAVLPEAEDLKERLQQVLEAGEAYFDEDLTLSKLAEQLPTTDKKLSLLLNQYLNTSFYDYVNQHRVAAVKQMMADDRYGTKPNIEIAYACGFKSKSSFNRVFKKMVGMTPGAWRSQLLAKKH